MNRQLISNQPLKDDLEELENIDFFQSQYKKPTFDSNEEHKEKSDSQNQSAISETQQAADTKKETNPWEDGNLVSKKTTHVKRYHQLQVIDEDAEHFKTKLDNLINNFRTETMSEFMSIKRSLLEEQTESIESETRKYTKLLENRTNELDKTKEALAKKMKELERAEVITHVVADWSGIARNKSRNVLLLSKCFNGFKHFKERQDHKKKTMRMSDMIYNKKCVAKVFGSMRDSHTKIKEENIKKENESVLNRELGELAAKYNKEIELLTNRLNEALSSLDEANKNKEEIQENLKKAFMRGVCALNFEAMSILKTKEGQEEPSEEMVMNKQIGNIGKGDPTYNSLVLNPVDNNTSYNEEREKSNRETFTNSSPKKNIVFYQNPKLESKEMRWRDAPVVGLSQPAERKPAKETILKASSYGMRVENKENEKDENASEDYQHHTETVHGHKEDEGRVIKVTNGKSYGTSAANGTMGKQTKPVEKGVTVNTNKAAQLRQTLAKAKK